MFGQTQKQNVEIAETLRMFSLPNHAATLQKAAKLVAAKKRESYQNWWS